MTIKFDTSVALPGAAGGREVMIETSDEVQPAHPAATVVLVRDTARGIETLLVQRNQALNHMGGMWVFPGGRLDQGDQRGAGSALAAARNAAVRESREETGLDLQPGQLAYMSHWTTPAGARKRFATWFFLAVLEDGQSIRVDGSEIADHRWVTPAQALAELADPEHPLSLLPPTYISLLDIADYADCAEAYRAMVARQAPQFAPRMVFVDGGICFLYEGDAGYATEDLQACGPRHRTYMLDGQLEYINEQ